MRTSGNFALVSGLRNDDIVLTNGQAFVSPGDEIKYKSATEQELLDETDPDDYEDKTFRMKYIDDNPELAEEQNKDDGIKDLGKLKSTDEEDEEDWQDFNRRKQEELNRKKGKKVLSKKEIYDYLIQFCKNVNLFEGYETFELCEVFADINQYDSQLTECELLACRLHDDGNFEIKNINSESNIRKRS